MTQGDVVWTQVLILPPTWPHPTSGDLIQGYEPHEVVTVAGERLVVRSLTTGRRRVVRTRDVTP